MSKPFVFLSYAREDKAQVDDIYRQLKAAGLNPWMDKPPAPLEREGIPIGAHWEPYVREKLREAIRVLAFLSHTSVAKTGFVQREYRIALGLMAERPVSQQWLIPIRLDDCRPPAHRDRPGSGALFPNHAVLPALHSGRRRPGSCPRPR